ncbi:phosphogluconate dehydratase [Marisediminitalea aggregata]|jgi:phosphogluconate dehydratase|uniref:Phosphogluconate dehydratase n=3 Tax=Alteromonadaceae TaxID=72275 RepID=A0A1M5J3B3_9ALTE|nr:phosphogluconate dehydratase [Marisediminitalea aggregata]MAP23207.1 phosphogluconate dehydratase [Alteromonadaceae bacterium]MCP3862688.1 phosphogluconate dehydratase [Aestuariibacter sp.]MEC7824408.1 phosphogluconate dehydratase [Pseudomonadota bacterium]HBY41081.1 phosphogluconate dehydratase [Alteromonas sp.]MAX42416.1 phosphogluconate dehydratase [Alteromonadaceae bacterium]|tara:strand:+ start:48405 stop:50234 length:1830 start_codon:yes stop_codon:yes gene_type:complete
MNSQINDVTQRIIERSRATRQAYLAKIDKARRQGPHRGVLSCGNLAHGFAACNQEEKSDLRSMTKANIAIVSSYNDMLSAHQPYETYPQIIKDAVKEVGSVAQFAGGVPAMCDGVTQGNPGMELSLMSRDVIALSAAVGLSHNMFDGAMMLGICDKIVPGLLIGSLSFGHLPTVFVPAGPMPSGLPNKEKARVRQAFAEGKAGRDELLEAESQSYHSAGTCTFYGTANSNQLVVEMMGLHLPGSSFVNPGTALRDELTRAASRQVTRLTDLGDNYTPIGHIVDEKAVVNGIVALLATGGSTNHTMHLIAVARAAGIIVNWDDFSDLSNAVPLLTRIYPNGSADINHFVAAGGMALLFKELLDNGLIHNDVKTICGDGLEQYTKEPVLEDGELVWRDGPTKSHDKEVFATVSEPFKPDGGLSVLSGNLGRAVIKTSALKNPVCHIKAPAVVFEDQYELDAAFKAGDLDKDCIVVVRFQGPAAIGMPELHRLTPPLGVLQDRGFKVALVTDGRMSGASGKVPAAIHVTPEAYLGGLLSKVESGDIIELNTATGELTLCVDEATLAQRTAKVADLTDVHQGMGREMFGGMRGVITGAEEGACTLFYDQEQRV